MRIVLATLFLVTISLTSGCSTEVKPVMSPAAINTVCPIMGGKVTPDGGSTLWNNQTVGFCCDGCLPDWEKLTEDQKIDKIAKANSNPDDQMEHDHEGHQHDAHQHSE